MISPRSPSLRFAATTGLGLAFLALGSAPGAGNDATPTQPNVVVIAIDTLRPDHLGLYGYPSETAPFLSALGKESTVFRNAVSSSSWTAPAIASLFTGLYPTEHGVVRGFWFDQDRIRAEQGRGAKKTIAMNALPKNVATLAEIFRAAGYRTFGLTANISIGPEIGFDRGFDRFARLNSVGREVYPEAEKLFNHLVTWIGEIRGASPYFLYLHFNDPHEPQYRRQPWFGVPGREAGLPVQEYDSEISYVDSFLRRVDEFLVLRTAIAIVLSDHGQAFGEHGRLGHGPHTGLFGEVNRILLMMSAPALGARGRVVSATVSIVDVLPTLCELAGLPAPRAASGVSLVPLVRQEAAETKRFTQRALFAHVVGKRLTTQAVFRGPWKLVRNENGARLYDIARDPREERDVAAAHRAIADELNRLLDQQPKAASTGERVEVELDDEELERLRTLGYAE